jgi:hypothetical protein
MALPSILASPEDFAALQREGWLDFCRAAIFGFTASSVPDV